MSHSSFTYRPEIDGLRAVAVIPVVLFHAGLGVSGGYVGVDVFFVISGFLITKLILKDLERGQFSIVDFWERRIRRIFPALYAMLFVTLIAGFFLFLPWDYEDLGRSAMMQSLFSSNFYFWSESGYFEGPAEVKPLLHTWSLAVEEQFYFLFPALLLLLWKRSLTWVVGIFILLWILSLGLSAVGVYRFASATFYLLPMRAWELLTGALLAFGSGRLGRFHKLKESASAAGLFLILFACFTFDSNTRFPGPSALFPCLGTALFVWANEGERTLSGKLLSWKPIVFVGLISYSLYLWHWPAFAFANRMVREISVPLAVGIVLGSVVLAFLSWQFIEKPFRKRSYASSRSKVFKFALGLTLVSISAGAVLDGFDGIPSRVPESVVALGDQERNPEFRVKTTIADLTSGELLPLGRPAADAADVSFLLWGDSHAMAIAPAIDRLAEEHSMSGVGAMRGGTPPMLGVWVNNTSVGDDVIPYNQAVVDYLAKEKIECVIIAARWAKYINGRFEDPLDGIVVDAENPHISTEGAIRAFERGVVRTVDELINSGAKVYIVKQVPDHAVDVPREIADRLWRGLPMNGLGISLAQHRKDQVETDRVFDIVAAKGVMFVDPAPMLFLPNGEPVLVAKGKSLYRDEDHVSDAGAFFLLPVFGEIFRDMSQGTRPARVESELQGD